MAETNKRLYEISYFDCMVPHNSQVPIPSQSKLRRMVTVMIMVASKKNNVNKTSLEKVHSGVWSVHKGQTNGLYSEFSPVPLPELCFDSFSFPIAPIVSSTGGIVQFTYLLFAEPITNSVWKATAFSIFSLMNFKANNRHDMILLVYQYMLDQQ